MNLLWAAYHENDQLRITTESITLQETNKR